MQKVRLQKGSRYLKRKRHRHERVARLLSDEVAGQWEFRCSICCHCWSWPALPVPAVLFSLSLLDVEWPIFRVFALHVPDFLSVPSWWWEWSWSCSSSTVCCFSSSLLFSFLFLLDVEGSLSRVFSFRCLPDFLLVFSCWWWYSLLLVHCSRRWRSSCCSYYYYYYYSYSCCFSSFLVLSLPDVEWSIFRLFSFRCLPRHPLTQSYFLLLRTAWFSGLIILLVCLLVCCLRLFLFFLFLFFFFHFHFLFSSSFSFPSLNSMIHLSDFAVISLFSRFCFLCYFSFSAFLFLTFFLNEGESTLVQLNAKCHFCLAFLCL